MTDKSQTLPNYKTKRLKQYFPKAWRDEKVTLIGKIPVPKEFKNIRNISIIPFWSKVSEKVIIRRLEPQINYDISQFGFQKGVSLEHALAYLQHLVNKHIDKNEANFCVLLCLDIKAAFPTICSRFLLWALCHLGAEEDVCNLLMSYFQDRQYRVKYKGVRSHTVTTTLGVIQGALVAHFYSLLQSAVSDAPSRRQ